MDSYIIIIVPIELAITGSIPHFQTHRKISQEHQNGDTHPDVTKNSTWISPKIGGSTAGLAKCFKPGFWTGKMKYHRDPSNLLQVVVGLKYIVWKAKGDSQQKWLHWMLRRDQSQWSHENMKGFNMFQSSKWWSIGVQKGASLIWVSAEQNPWFSLIFFDDSPVFVQK
jgi:hypothetical protein